MMEMEATAASHVAVSFAVFSCGPKTTACRDAMHVHPWGAEGLSGHPSSVEGASAKGRAG